MKRIICLLAVFVSVLCSGAEKKNIYKIAPYLINVTETSATVIFTTVSDALCWVEVAEYEDGAAWYRDEHYKFFEDVAGRHYVGKNHRIVIEGLKPGVRYSYRVIGQEVVDSSNPYKYQFGKTFPWNPIYGQGSRHARTCSFITLNPIAEKCSFSMVCDIHFKVKKYEALMSAMPKENDFIVLCGDICSHSSNIDTVIAKTFKPIESKAAYLPVFFARGNHEGRGKDSYLVPYYFPTPTGHFYYTFRQGPVAFVVLDAGEDKPDSDIEYSGTAAYNRYRLQELEWLKKAVKDKDFASAPHKVCLIHIPTIANKDSWYTQKWISENFAPVLGAAGVKLMLSGHHHKNMLFKPGQAGCDYTVFVNSNEERLDFFADSKSIQLSTYDKEGNKLHSLEL